MMRHAVKVLCHSCGTKREVVYDQEADEEVCKHCKEVIVPKGQRLSATQRDHLRCWKIKHRPDATPHRDHGV